MKKVIAVIIAIAVVIMFVIGIKTLLTTNTKENAVVSSYFPVYSECKWGVIEQNGKIVIEPTMEEMITIPNSKKDIFICLTNVDYDKQTYQTKVLNAKNQEIFKEYDLVEAIENNDNNKNLWYEEGILRVKKGELYGLIDYSGKEILPTQYQEIYALEGVKNSLILKKDDKLGLCDNQANIIVPVEYSKIMGIKGNYQNGYIVVNSEGKYGIIDFNKAVILETKYEDIKEVTGSNLYVIKENGSYKLINKSEEVILEDGFDEIRSIDEKNIIIVKDKKYGVISTEKEEKVKPQYDELSYLYNQYYLAKKDGKYGIINEKNEMMLPFEYNSIIYRDEAGIIEAEKEGNEWSEIYSKELEKKLDGIIEEVNNKKAYFRLRKEEGYYYYNFKFEEKKPWEVLSDRKLFLSKKDGKYGYVDKEENVIVDYLYEEATELNEYGFASVKKDGKWGSINKEGNMEAQNKYELSDNIIIDFIGKWHLGQDLNAYYYTDK